MTTDPRKIAAHVIWRLDRKHPCGVQMTPDALAQLNEDDHQLLAEYIAVARRSDVYAEVLAHIAEAS